MGSYEIDNLIRELSMQQPKDFHPDYLKKISALKTVIENFFNEVE